jgi:hypothetical protein
MVYGYWNHWLYTCLQTPTVFCIGEEEAGGRTIHSEIHKPINSVWNKEEWPQQWKESIIVPICMKGDKTDCRVCGDMSVLSTMCKILSNILLSRLTSYAEKITGDHQCGIWCNRSTTDCVMKLVVESR